MMKIAYARLVVVKAEVVRVVEFRVREGESSVVFTVVFWRGSYGCS